MKKTGFSLIEIMATLALIGIVILPLTTMLFTAKKSVLLGEKFLVVSNLAREKAEEIKVIPFGAVKSDFDNFRSIYKECSDPGLKDAYEIPSFFYEVFSDIWSEQDKEKNESLYELFRKKYLDVYGQEYLLYSGEPAKYRRFLLVEESYSENRQPLKKISVHVYAREKKDEPIFTLHSSVIP